MFKSMKSILTSKGEIEMLVREKTPFSHQSFKVAFRSNNIFRVKYIKNYQDADRWFSVLMEVIK